VLTFSPKKNIPSSGGREEQKLQDTFWINRKYIRNAYGIKSPRKGVSNIIKK
jgi:hypothetical protein